MVCYDSWHSDATEAVKTTGANRLVLVGVDSTRGQYQEIKDVLPQICSIRIDLQLPDLSIFYGQPGIERLEVDVAATGEIDFTRFPGLRTCHLAFQEGCESILGCEGLRALVLYGVSQDILPRSHLPRLSELSVIGGTLRTLQTIGPLPSLKRLYIASTAKLETLPDLNGSKSLERFTLFRCRNVVGLAALGACPSLKSLSLIDCGGIETLEFARDLALEEVNIGGDTNVLDGQVHFLSEVPSLKKVVG